MTDVKEIGFVKEWLVDALPYEVFWASEDGDIFYGNQKLCDQLKYGKSEIKKLTIFDINTTATPESWRKHWATVKKKRSETFKAVHRDKKGKFYEVEVFAQFFSNNGKEMICSIMNDITSSSFYKNLVDNVESIAKVGGWKLNLQDGSIIVTNEAFKIFNTDNKENFLPRNIIHSFTDSEKLKGYLTQTIRKGIPFDAVFETNEIPKRYIRAVAKPELKGDKVFKVIGIYQDVTVQKTFEKQLHLYKNALDSAPDLIYIIDKNGTIVYHNKAICTELGYTQEEMKDKKIQDLDYQVTSEFWKSLFQDVIEKGSVRMEWLAIRKDQTRYPADVFVNHLQFAGVDLICSVLRNVSERKKRDVQLFEALEEIKSLKDRLEIENEYLQEEINIKLNADNIISKSQNYAKILEKVQQVAPTNTTVLITGESGTGKELLARAVHNNSDRKERPLIKINAATLPKELIESELFGHKKGSFTGAVADKLGKFALADGGTIFLDEIGEMPLDLQPKLLRVLQEGEFDEVGGTKTQTVDVRIVAATNRKLEEMVKEGTFREDLYYRLNVFPIDNLPLRARKEDIPLLAQYFLEKYSAKAGKAFKRLSKKTISALMNYDFPGNIRELENLIERAVIVENGTTLNPGNWIPKSDTPVSSDSFKSFETMQRDHIIDVLNYTNWRVSGDKGAATILQMKDKTLFAKMKRLGIEKKVGLKST